jgi:hypothetical protein
MCRAFSLTGRILALAVGGQLLAVGAASAHGLKLEATSVCSAGEAVINYTVTSTSSLSEGSHNQIVVAVNNLAVQTGVFAVATGNTFSGSTPAPSGTLASVSATAVGGWLDGALGGQSASVSVAIATDCTPTEKPGVGRFTGGGFQLRASAARVTRGLTIHCDLLLSNNLEINWGGNKFHMLEHLETLTCADDPTIVQAPPVAPIDTLIGVGSGRYNGNEGYTIQFMLVDAGEPGVDDMMAIRIYETANPGNVVLNVPLSLLDGGNLQAHYDQPHGSRK